MKKKFITLVMAFALVLSNAAVVSAADEYLTEEPKVEITKEMTGTEAMSHIGEENAIFLDLRSAEDYAAGHIKGTVSAPVCLPASESYKVPVANRDAFIAQMEELKVAENDTTLYLSCYAGTFCVNYAADWLMTYCDVEESQLVRVLKGTFGDAELAAASNFTLSSYALNAAKEGNGIILDVRATEVYYEKGYIDGTLHQPLFYRVDGSNKVADHNDKEDELVKNFNAFIDANEELLTNNNIYILCNGGASGAKAATALLKEAGMTSNVYTIEGGANALYGTEGLFVNQQYVSGSDAVAVSGTATVPSANTDKVIIIDVRAVERYNVGHIKGALSYPVFTVDENDKNVVTSGSDQLAQDFLAKVEANADKFAGKNIYIVCNSGASGAKAATKLLMQAGYSNSVIYTVEGGAKGTTEDMSVPNNSTFVSPAQALSVLENEAYVILDVRAVERYENGTLPGSVNVPLFTVDENGKNVPVQAPYEDELSMAFKAYVEENKEELSSKTIYILCNSGETGARNANTLLAEAGLTNVFSIDGGAAAYTNGELVAPGVDGPEVDEPEVDEPEVNEPEVDEPADDEATEKDETENNAPDTGDEAPIMAYAFIMFAAVAVFVVSKKRLA